MAVVSETLLGRLDLNVPRWDQSTFSGRFKHFFAITDWRKALYTNKQLDDYQHLVNLYRQGKEPPGMTEDEIWYAQHVADSAFHADTGERMNLMGRMSFQVPGGMAITGAMMQWYRTIPAVVFWQWVNQSFNALVNYTNRNAKSEVTSKQITVAYLSATTGAMAVAIGLNTLTKTAPPLLARYVPFAAVATANCVNIPLMRQREIMNGIVVFDENNNPLGLSKNAAHKSIAQVVASRITMAAPGMLIVPIIMEKLETYPFMKRIRPLHGPLQILLCGVSLTFMVPAACSLFPQRSSMAVRKLEPELQEAIRKREGPTVNTVYFNKGL